MSMVHTSPEFTYILADLTTNSEVVTAKRCILRGIHVKETVGSNDVPLKAGGASGTQIATIPAGSLAGAWFPFGDVQIDNFTVDAADAETAGELLIVFKEVNP